MTDATPTALKLSCCVGLGLTWLQNVRLREVIEVGCVVDAFDLNRDRGRPFSATSTREGGAWSVHCDSFSREGSANPAYGSNIG